MKEKEDLKEEKQLVMPMTAAFMAQANGAPDNRYTGKRVRQNLTKQRNIRRRERRLNKIGWSLKYFKK